jgi:hypothetical protein
MDGRRRHTPATGTASWAATKAKSQKGKMNGGRRTYSKTYRLSSPVATSCLHARHCRCLLLARGTSVTTLPTGGKQASYLFLIKEPGSGLNNSKELFAAKAGKLLAACIPPSPFLTFPQIFIHKSKLHKLL